MRVGLLEGGCAAKCLIFGNRCSNLHSRGGDFFLRKARRYPIGIQSGRIRAPILHFFGTAFGQSGSSRDPVGHQFWNISSTCREAAKFVQKVTFLEGFGTLLNDFSCFPTGPKVVPKTANLVPGWIWTGSRLAKSGVKKCKIGADWIPAISRLDP